MEITPITPEILSMAAGIIVSVVLSYIPGLRPKWALLDPDYKRLILLIILALLSLGIVLLSCYGVIPFIVCDKGGLIKFLTIFGASVISSQAAYMVSPGLSGIKAKALASEAAKKSAHK